MALFVILGGFSLWLDHFSGRISYATLGYDLISHGQVVWGYSLICLVMTCIISASLGNSILNNITDLPAFQHLGKISYGMYVYHTTVLVPVKRIFPLMERDGETLSEKALKIFLFGVVLGGTIFCAYFSFKYFERFFLKMKTRVALSR